MAIPESQLDTWSAQGAVQQSKTTYATVKGVLESSSAPYSARSHDSFLQGSYGNDTNVYADSDVDVVMRLSSIYYDELWQGRRSRGKAPAARCHRAQGSQELENRRQAIKAPRHGA
jgi:hypothetical protein